MINTPDITPAVSHLILLIVDLFDIIQSHSERQRSERIASIFEREKKTKKKNNFFISKENFFDIVREVARKDLKGQKRNKKMHLNIKK